jgi:regulator of replication initiation timing
MNSPGWEKLVEELEAKIAALKSSNSQMFAELNRQELEIQDLRARLEMYRDHSVQAIANKRIAELESYIIGIGCQGEWCGKSGSLCDVCQFFAGE